LCFGETALRPITKTARNVKDKDNNNNNINNNNLFLITVMA